MTVVDEPRGAPEDEAWQDDPWDAATDTLATMVERPRRGFRPLRFIVWLALILAVIGLLVGGGVAFWYVRQINPSGTPGTPTNFTVDAKDTVYTVSVRLEKEGFITNAKVFRWYLRHQGGLTLTPGYYVLRPKDHMGNILRVLRTPPAQTYSKVTFPEGFTVEQMADRLAAKVPRLSASAFIAAASSGKLVSQYSPEGSTSLEGLLFPDTYQVSNDDSPGQLIARQISLMERVGRQEQIVEKGYALALTSYQVLIIASIVEREAKVEEDRPMIARVILNRLAAGMPLEIDATLLYQQDPKAKIGDLKQIDTPYNTYMHTGLPPTPISNPGRASIHAVVNPASDPPEGGALCKGLEKGQCHWYYYVLADVDGHHAFAVTAEQHQANVDKARALNLIPN